MSTKHNYKTHSAWMNFLCEIGEIANVFEKYDKVQKPEDNPDDVDILTGEKLRELKWLSTSQLAAIYGYGKNKKAKVADNEDAYRELKWLSHSQLSAIFGRQDEN